MAVDPKSLTDRMYALAMGGYPYPTGEAVARILVATELPPVVPCDEAGRLINFAIHNYEASRSLKLATKNYRDREVSDGERLLKLMDDLAKQLQTAFALNIIEGDALQIKAMLAENMAALAPLVDARLEAAKQRKQKRKRHSQENANIILIMKLIDTYKTIFGRRSGLSTDNTSGKPSGPMLRFLRAAVNEIGAEMTDEGIAMLARRIRNGKAKLDFVFP